MKLENVLGVIGGIVALVGCLLPVATRGALSLNIGEAGALSYVLYLCAIAGLLVSGLALIGKMTREEWPQVAIGAIGLVVTFLVHRQMNAEHLAFGMHLLYWGFAMVLAEGLIHFGENGPKVGVPRP